MRRATSSSPRVLRDGAGALPRPGRALEVARRFSSSSPSRSSQVTCSRGSCVISARRSSVARARSASPSWSAARSTASRCSAERPGSSSRRAHCARARASSPWEAAARRASRAWPSPRRPSARSSLALEQRRQVGPPPGLGVQLCERGVRVGVVGVVLQGLAGRCAIAAAASCRSERSMAPMRCRSSRRRAAPAPPERGAVQRDALGGAALIAQEIVDAGQQLGRLRLVGERAPVHRDGARHVAARGQRVGGAPRKVARARSLVTGSVAHRLREDRRAALRIRARLRDARRGARATRPAACRRRRPRPAPCPRCRWRARPRRGSRPRRARRPRAARTGARRPRPPARRAARAS